MYACVSVDWYNTHIYMITQLVDHRPRMQCVIHVGSNLTWGSQFLSLKMTDCSGCISLSCLYTYDVTTCIKVC